uniref:hypothetical protein n=1 Tax=Pseudomonas sp. Z13 TaxID=2983409 RepID=UPI002E807C30
SEAASGATRFCAWLDISGAANAASLVLDSCYGGWCVWFSSRQKKAAHRPSAPQNVLIKAITVLCKN